MADSLAGSLVEELEAAAGVEPANRGFAVLSRAYVIRRDARKPA
jgi:hypothetical protein